MNLRLANPPKDKKRPKTALEKAEEAWTPPPLFELIKGLPGPMRQTLLYLRPPQLAAIFEKHCYGKSWEEPLDRLRKAFMECLTPLSEVDLQAVLVEILGPAPADSEQQPVVYIEELIG